MPQPAAEIEMLDRAAFSAQTLGQLAHQFEGFFQRRQILDLAADVHRKAARAQVMALRGVVIKRDCVFGADAEFRVAAAGRYLRIGPGADAGIDAD